MLNKEGGASLSPYENTSSGQNLEVDKHITSSDHNYVISKYVHDKTSSSPLRYISGFVDVTLLQGYAAVNGYSMSVGESISIKSPPWTPAYVLELSQGHRLKKNKKSAKKEKVAKTLKRLKNIISESVDDASLNLLLSNQNTLESIFFNMNEDSSIPTVIMYRGIPVEEQEWMVAAEDTNSKYQIQFDRMKQRNSGNGCFESSCVCVGSGLIGDMISMQQSGLDITVIPVTWSNTATSLYDSMKSGIESYLADSNAESESYVRIADDVVFPPYLCQKYMICGAKGVGKSTSVKYVINTMLSKGDACITPITAVAILDCDAGQPEFNVPGTLSLNLVGIPVTSPPHLHLQNYPPVESYFLGEVTTKLTPERFSAALQLLMKRYEELRLNTWNKMVKERRSSKSVVSGSSSNSGTMPVSQSLNKFDVLNNSKSFVAENEYVDVPLPCDGVLPLIINCDGNIRFMGNEILSAVINICQPTDVLHISTDKDRIIPAIHQSEEVFNHYHSEQKVYRQSRERLMELEQQLEEGHTMEVEESEADLGVTMSVTMDTSVSAAAAYETLTKHQKAIASTVSSAVKKKKKQSSVLQKQVDELRSDMARISSTVIYPYNIFSLQPGRVVASRISGADLRNLRLVSYFLRENTNIKRVMMGLYQTQKSMTAENNENERIATPVVAIKNGNLIDPGGVIAIELLKIAPIALNLTDIALRSAISDIPTRLILAAINVSLVGLLFPSTHCKNALSHNSKPRTFSIPNPNGRDDANLNPSLSPAITVAMDCNSEFVLEPCLGVGIVRDILIGDDGGNVMVTTCESVRNRLHSFINSNSKFDTKPVVLMSCNIPLPSTLLYTIDFSCGSGNESAYPYYSSELHGEGSNSMKHRNNVKRKR